MNLQEEILAAYAELKKAMREVHDIETALDELRQGAMDRHWEELKGARSLEAQNRAIHQCVKGDEEYQEMLRDLPEAKIRLDIAKTEIAMLDRLIQVAGID